MKTHTLANTGHSISFRKLAKPLGLCFIAIFVISMVSVFATTGVQAATTTPALHTSGNQILDSNNNVVYLRGIGLYTGASGAPNWIFWNSQSSPNSDSWSDQWNFSENPTMEQNAIVSTMQTWQQTWHVNMIRVFIFPGLYPTITPAQADSGTYGGDNTQYNILTSLQGLCAVAAQYGIYVDICPQASAATATETGTHGLQANGQPSGQPWPTDSKATLTQYLRRGMNQSTTVHGTTQ